jgi:PAS domain S-box-containing protein
MKDEEKTKEQFIEELAELRQRIAELEVSEAQCERAEWVLGERMKELTCLYTVSHDMQEDLSTDELCRRVVEYLVPAMQFPEIVVPVIELNGRRFTSERYTEGLSHGLHAEIRVEGEAHGHLWVYYAEDRPFLIPEEQNLVNGVAEALSLWLERKRVEEALRESREKYREIINGMNDTVWVIGFAGGFVDVNETAVKVSGYSREKLLSMGPADIDSHLTEEQIKDLIRRMPSDEIQVFETEHTSKEGKTIPVEISSSLVSYQGKRAILSIARDITERKRAEEELHRRAKELAALQATVLDITAPHDLPTLLQTIVERAALLLNALGGGLYLCDPDRREVRCMVSYNTPHDYTGTVLKYGEGAAGTVAQTRQPLIIDDYRVWNRRAAVYEEEQPFTAVLSAPMIWQGQVTGVIHVLHDVESRRFTEADLELLILFANHAAIAVENARLYEEARQEITERKQRERELEAIAAMSAALRTATTRTEMLPVILDQLLDLLKVEGAALGIRDPTIDETVIELGRGVWADWTDIRLPPGEGISGHVISTGQFYLNNDVQNDPRMTHLHLLGDLRAVACVPLIAQERIIGVLWMGRKTDITEEEARLLTAIADMFANAIQRATLHEQTEKRAQHLAALHSVDMAISSTLDLTKVLDIILEELERVIPYHDAGIFLFSNGTAKLTAGRGFPDLERVLQVSFPVQEDALTREVLREKRPLVLADAQADDRFLLTRGGTVYVRSWIGAPLIAKGKAIGLLTVDHREPGAYDEESAEMVQAFANQAAIAIENAQLYEETQRELAERKRAEEKLRRSYVELRRALEGTVNVLTSAIEIRDPYTAGHQRRVTNLACAIATEMGLSEEQIEGLRMAGLIHDVGKINVPADILSKPGRLSDLEYGLIKAHPQVGYDILKGVDFPWPVAEMVLQHHERMDGSGYPQGLSGEEIMLEARVLAVADVVAAIASHRPYRPALGIEKALEEISMNRGVLYEPEVVDVCLRLFIEKRFTFE